MAYEQLKKNYDNWRHAYGDLPWNEYLERLLGTEGTGSWVVDIIKLELKPK